MKRSVAGAHEVLLTSDKRRFIQRRHFHQLKIVLGIPTSCALDMGVHDRQKIRDPDSLVNLARRNLGLISFVLNERHKLGI